MKILITAGNTQVPIDQVRSITNIFRGRTGVAIANCFADMGADVTLVTSNKEMVNDRKDLQVIYYKTYHALAGVMADHIQHHHYDVVIHSAAVSDYTVNGVYAKDACGALIAIDADAKISSKYEHLYLELSPTEKLIDKIRGQWGFCGKLIKFKLEVGKTREELIDIAVRSMQISDADMIVANSLEWSSWSAIIINAQKSQTHVSRNELPHVLWRMINE